MDARGNVRIGMTAEKTVTVPPRSRSVTVILLRTAAGLCHADDDPAYGNGVGSRHRASHLPNGLVSVGMDVKVRHLAATPVGRTVRAISCVIQIDPKSVVEAWDGNRKIAMAPIAAASSMRWSSSSVSA
jgi:fluoroacetyl-CoA thioesterase